jgi:menaquinone-dependent protoporphyrinogen IX oxidase
MRKTLLVYESKYGSTEEIIKKMALVLGTAIYCKSGEFRSEFRDCDFIVIGAPVYAERVDKRMYDFVSENISWLRNKDVALFCTCLVGEEGGKYLDPMIEILARVSLGQRQ